MQIDRSRYGYIYRITNLINSKTYVGKHKISRNEKFLDYMGSGRLIVRAVKKYGKNNFQKEILSYEDNEQELSLSEIEHIKAELEKGCGEYNIEYSNSALRANLSQLGIRDEQLISWYLDDNMSFMDIATKINCSYPTIYLYMQKIKHLDKRFESIRQGDNRGKHFGFTAESHKKAVAKNTHKVECKICNSKISHANFSKHSKICEDENFTYVDGVKKKTCANQQCDVLIYTKNTHCKKHFILASPNMEHAKTYESCRKGGITASHIRWHVNRGVVNPDCAFCSETP